MLDDGLPACRRRRHQLQHASISGGHARAVSAQGDRDTELGTGVDGGAVNDAGGDVDRLAGLYPRGSAPVEHMQFR